MKSQCSRVLSLSSILWAASLLIGSVTPVVAQVATRGLHGHAPESLKVGGVLFPYAWDDVWDVGQPKVIAEREFSAITAGFYMPYDNWMDWQYELEIPPDPTPLVDFVTWANEQSLAVHGHVLLWPAANQDLDWYQNLPSGNHAQAIQFYIDVMAGSTAGQVWSWDVVNEVMADDDDDPSNIDPWGLRTDYIEYQSIGADYVDQAFTWAKSADPNAQLILNDYGTEEIGFKSNNLFRYANELRRRGVPIDGIGFQVHLWDLDIEPDYQSIRRNFARFADAGFDIYITELDVRSTRSDSADELPTPGQLERQRVLYEEIARIASSSPQVKSFLMWDYVDGRSWLNPISFGQEIGIYANPAIYFGGAAADPIMAKPAYQGIIDGFRDGTNPVNLSAEVRRLGWIDGSNRSFINRRARASAPSEPIAAAELYPLNELSRPWDSMKWKFVPAGNGYYLIVNQWQADSGFLTRQRIPYGDDWLPGDQLRVLPRQPDWDHQLWRFERHPGGGYRIVNAWQPASGVLTRVGTPGIGSSIALWRQVDDCGCQDWVVYGAN